MGIIGEAFGNLFGVIWDAVLWVAYFFRDLFQTIIDYIVEFITVFFSLIAGLMYVIYKIGVLAVKLFLVFFEAGKILVSLIVGLTRTLGSLFYSPGSSAGHGYSDTIGKVFKVLEPLQLAPIAYICLFLIWFTTAISAIKIIQTMRNL